MSDVVLDRTRRFLDYLAAVARTLTTTPERDVREAATVAPIWPERVPDHRAVLLGPAEGRPAWLVVRKVQEPPAPALPEILLEEVAPSSLEDFEGGPRLRFGLPPAPSQPEDSGDFPATADTGLVPMDADDAVDSGQERPTREELQQVLDDWTVAEWRPWVERVRPARAARALYSDLFALHLFLQANQATHELAWGHSLLSWRVDREAVFAPLVTSRMTIEVDEDDGSLSLVPERPCELELDALEGLSLPVIEELSGLRERLRAVPPDPWLSGGLDQVNSQIVAPLGLDARINDMAQPPEPGQQPVLTPTWVLFARRRPLRHERFYSQLAEVIDETGFIPEGVAAVVADDTSIEQVVVASGVQEGDNWRTTADRPLLPLASNEDQERIIRQLATARGVTVQGPPGTGKTHTIANLVSHLVAHGKRVLVTAQNEQALAVLQDKIPPELRDLSVAVLGSSPEAMDQLRASAQAMTDLVSGLDEERELRRVDELSGQVDELRTEIRRTDLALVEALRAEEAEFDLPSGPAKAAEVAEWLARTDAELGRIPDRVGRHQELPLTDAEVVDLHRLCTGLPLDDIAAVRQARPSAGELPVSDVLHDEHDRLDRLRQQVADLEQDGVDLASIDALDDAALACLAEAAASAAERLRRLEEPWLSQIREAIRQSPDIRGYWAEQAEHLARRAADLVALQRRVVGWAVEAPVGDHRQQHQLLDELAARFGAGKGVPRFGGRELRELHEAVRVNGLPVRTTEEIDVVRAFIRLRVESEAAQVHLRHLADQANVPVPSAGAAFVAGVNELSQRMQDALRWEDQDRAALRSELRRALAVAPDHPDAAQMRRIAGLLAGARVRRDERRLSASLGRWAEHLDNGRELAGASPLWGRLRVAFGARRWDMWDEALAECARLEALESDVRGREALLSRLRVDAPQWAARLGAAAPEALELAPDRWREAWRWAQAETWLQELHTRGELERLQTRSVAQRERLRELVIDLGKRSAAIGLKRNLRDAQRRALSGWLTALRKAGKQTGKYAPHWMQEARNQLPEAMGAVPIWIMPIHRVIENFDPRRSELFDVVIVDESSQCDLLSVGVLALGRKSVVVGDDKQTSPAGVGIDRTSIMQLQSSYLADVPQKALLTVDESLYGIAERAFPNVVMLREHFRCVTEIIQFSNRYYDHRILPLRERTREGIGPVLRAVHVADGACTGTSSNRLNCPEAAALVDQVAACAADPVYDGASFGVVSLQSGAQAREIERRLTERLGFEEFQRRHLRVGNPSAFQGDERDVVFVSVVADDNGYAATRTADKQRVNVAASRARDQLWVFHTVDPATLHADDQRRALIEYVRDAETRRQEADDLLERCDSGFERDVVTQLLQRNYDVTVQHRVGNYRIDLVVQGERDRLAIECDGDWFHGPEQWENDLRRQRVLERLGWKFWRILASTYYRDPLTSLDPLWERLEQLGIRPRAAHPASGPLALPGPEHGLSVADDAPAAEAAPWTSLGADLDQEPDSVIDLVAAPMVEQPVAAGVHVDPDPVGAVSPMSSPVPAIASTPAVVPPPAEALTAPAASPAPGRARTLVPVPDGYRLVGWIRPHEAAAVLQANEGRCDVPIVDDEVRIVGWARYHADDSDQARKFRSNVELQRISPTRGVRIVAWPKRVEAEAVVRAAREQRELLLPAGDGNPEILVQYFEPGSPEAIAYRSVTRLLRRQFQRGE